MDISIKKIFCKHLIKFNNDYIDLLKKNNEFLNPHYIINIKESIHYKSLITNNYDNYKKLIETTNQIEHSYENFKDLLKNFDLKKMKKIIVTYDRSNDRYLILDGVHRLSIILYKTIYTDNIPSNILNIINHNPRIDFLLLWSHGYKYKNNIINLLQKIDKLQIIKIQDFVLNNNILQILLNIYKNEDINHIINKSKYLLNYCKNTKNYNISIILLKNYDNNIRLYETDTKSSIIEDLKIYLRCIYNPKLKNRNIHPPPLKKGLSHNHIIHSSDTEDDTKHIIKFFNIDYKTF